MRAFAFLLFLLTLAAPASAEKRVALVIGNSAYAKAALSNPKVDARLIRPALERMGFEVEVVTDADLATFDRALGAFAARAKGADLALFYFAGHGFAVADGLQTRNYLMSTSADVTSTSDRVIRAGGVPLDEVIASLAAAAKTTLVFVDACRNDPRVRAPGGVGRGLSRIPDQDLEAVFVGLSTRLGDVAADGEEGEGSPFARAFAAHMPAPGLRVDDAFAAVRKAVIAATGGDQRPEAARDDLDAPLVLVTAEPGLPAAPAETSAPRPAAGVCAKAEAQFEIAREINTADAYQAFLETNGACPPYTGYARALIAKLSPAPPAPEEPEAAPQTDTEAAATCIRLTEGIASSNVNYAAAIPPCERALASDGSDARLQFGLAVSLDAAGRDVEAVATYRKAAEQGHVLAQVNLGAMYETGRGVARDYPGALAWYRKAAAQGNTFARNALVRFGVARPAP